MTTKRGRGSQASDTALAARALPRYGRALVLRRTHTVPAVAQAGKQLMSAQRERLVRRMSTARITRRRDASEAIGSRGGGPSRPADDGKTVDARNWGTARIPHRGLHAHSQQHELEWCATQKSLFCLNSRRDGLARS